jgi:hypothetical protein
VSEELAIGNSRVLVRLEDDAWWINPIGLRLRCSKHRYMRPAAIPRALVAWLAIANQRRRFATTIGSAAKARAGP